jgi:hypothetical protein
VQTVEILEGAKRVLTERGWTKDVLLDESTGCVCTLGALNIVLFGSARVDSIDWDDEEAVMEYRGRVNLRTAVSELITEAVPPEKVPTRQGWDDESGELTDERIPMEFFDVPDFNDFRGTTFGDVIAVLDVAIEKARTANV